MAQYIDKSALVAEIEKKLKNVNLNYVCAGSHPSDSDTNKKLQYGISKNLQSLLSFIDTLEVKEGDLEKLKRDWRNKGYIEGRKQALIPAEQLGLPRSLNLINMDETKIAAKEWADNNAGNCDYIGAVAAEKAFIACAQWLINKAKESKL